ncbi:MAG: histidine phosphatase family protein [Candidatus Xenobia bacterium]
MINALHFGHKAVAATVPTSTTTQATPQDGFTPSDATDHPARIIILRHGEKPDDSTDPNLAPQGEQRAQALANVIPQDYPNVSYIFASAPSKHSERPLETITPTAQKLGLSVNDQYADKDYSSLAQSILGNPQYDGKTIVICWHHGEIPALTQALGATPPTDKWPSDQFDRFWEIDYNANGQATLQNLPEHALPGDSN